jgi:small subunit ribosomal protein S4
MKKSNLKSPYQARQLVVHGHVSLGNRKINLPGYLVRKEEEPQILVHFTPTIEASDTVKNT